MLNLFKYIISGINNIGKFYVGDKVRYLGMDDKCFIIAIKSIHEGEARYVISNTGKLWTYKTTIIMSGVRDEHLTKID